MEDTTLSITGIIIAAIIMFIVPLVMIADRNDDISQLLVETYTAEFVDDIIKTGEITNEDYEQYLISLGTSGNTYEVSIELKILDENPARRHTNLTGGTGENFRRVYTLVRHGKGGGIWNIHPKKGPVSGWTVFRSIRARSAGCWKGRAVRRRWSGDFRNFGKSWLKAPGKAYIIILD